MRYLVTGSTGIVGKYLIKELLKNINRSNDQVVTISRRNRYFYEDHPGKEKDILLECYADLNSPPYRLITQFKPDIVFHCAGLGTQNSPSNNLWKSNVETTRNLLECCTLLQKPVKFLYCSSVVVNDYPHNMYATTKIVGETLVQSYSDIYENIEGTIVRFCAVAGAGNKHGVVKDVIAKLMDKTTDTISLINNSKKPILYAGNLVKDICYIVKNSNRKTYSLCPFDNISVASIVSIAEELINIKKNIEWKNNNIEERIYDSSQFFSGWSEDNVRLAIADILKEDYNE